MITASEKKNREQVLKLIQENPDIPIVPMVDGGCVYRRDDHGSDSK